MIIAITSEYCQSEYIYIIKYYDKDELLILKYEFVYLNKT